MSRPRFNRVGYAVIRYWPDMGPNTRTYFGDTYEDDDWTVFCDKVAWTTLGMARWYAERFRRLYPGHSCLHPGYSYGIVHETALDLRLLP